MSSSTPTADLNCDMGEGMPNDEAIMPFITSANIACGYHAGDESTMQRTIDLAIKYGVAIGAHPGFDDKPNFGRTEKQLTLNEIYQLVFKQVAVLRALCIQAKVSLHHVKPHGALYNMAAKNADMSKAIAQAVADTDSRLIVYGLSGSHLIIQAKLVGLRTASEVFADRTYQNDGSLTPRSHSNALISSMQQSVEQVLQMIQHKTVTSVTQASVPLQAETICLHGDGDHAVEFAQAIHQTLEQHHIEIKSI